MKKQAFTLAEVLITLAIIGVVAAISIPSVVANTQQKEFQTGLRKAVSVLNSAITMNMAIDGESPYDNADLPRYLMRHMSVMKSTGELPYVVRVIRANGQHNYDKNSAFYTTDGMRFEFSTAGGSNPFEGSNKLHESDQLVCTVQNSLATMPQYNKNLSCGGCGSYGLNNNPDATTKPPCMVIVDVNGDRKPTPANINCNANACADKNIFKVPYPGEIRLRDTFSIIITDKQAIPYGVTAQKAMYQAQKKK